MNDAKVLEMQREVGAETCAVCGLEKVPGKDFCKDCYFELSPKQRMSLNVTWQYGKGEVYEKCRDYLRHETERAQRL